MKKNQVQSNSHYKLTMAATSMVVLLGTVSPIVPLAAEQRNMYKVQRLGDYVKNNRLVFYFVENT